MPQQPRHPLDKNVSSTWKAPAGNPDQKPGMLWSDRIWHWLVSLGGVCIVGVGVLWLAFVPYIRRFGAVVIAVGLAIFILGFPSEAQRKGYRE
jgi:Flp pilus assembly protein TadB